DADPVELPVDPQRDLACVIDPVVANASMRIKQCPARRRLRSGEVGGLWRALGLETRVRARRVVLLDELIEAGLEGCDPGGSTPGCEPLLERLLDAFDLPAGLGGVGPRGLL